MAFFNSAIISAKQNSATISFARLACVVSLVDLQREVASLVINPWVDHFNKNDYRGGWDVLPLSCQRQFVDAHPILQGFSTAVADHWENLPVLEDCPQIKSIIAQLRCPVKTARLMRLAAGAEIKPHRDQGLGVEFGEARLHVPIHTIDAVSFLVDGKLLPMRAGELWYFNADQMHEVYNRSDEDRINLVIDCIANDWLCEQINGSP